MMQQPLAFRMRPTHLDEVVGQTHILGVETSLYKMIKSGKVPSLLLYGEPGIGKTSIANAIAGTVNFPFELINATTSGKKEVEMVVKKANDYLTEKKNALASITDDTAKEDIEAIQAMPEGLILAIDEVHRFNKIQQDALLPHVESGLITLIAMTTENPFHSVLPAVRSRCSLIKQLKRLEPQDIVSVLKRALVDKTKGLGNFSVSVSDDILTLIAHSTNGEVRSALNVLENSVFASSENEMGERVLTEEIVSEFLENKGFNHDKDGDGHYNVLSAFQKSIRGSDVDAALHYLARLIEAGDDTSIIRRLKVIAFEDIGLASKETVNFVCHACDCVRELGFPEARIPLADAVVALCLAPKSNSGYKALDLAIADVKEGYIGEIPMHLRDAHYASASKLGHVGYLYPHDHPVGSYGGWVKQQYLPDVLKDKQYYYPLESGQEKQLSEIHKRLNALKNKNNV